MILLTNPLETGDLDAAGAYTHVKVISFVSDPVNKFILIVMQYGKIVSSAFVPGKFSMESQHIIKDVGETLDYTTMVTKMPGDGETIYQSASRECYQYLLDKNVVVGTLV